MKDDGQFRKGCEICHKQPVNKKGKTLEVHYSIIAGGKWVCLYCHMGAAMMAKNYPIVSDLELDTEF